MKFSIKEDDDLQIVETYQNDERSFYSLEFRGKKFPLIIASQREAFAIALGCQWLVKILDEEK